MLLLINSVPGHPRALMAMYNQINVLMPSHTTSVLLGYGSRSNFNFQDYLRTTFHKGITAIDSDSPDGSGQSQLKIF